MSLSGLKVLVTRPQHQAKSLCLAIENVGGIALPFPVIEIKPAQDTQALQDCAAQLVQYDLAIFISANAVTQALPFLTSNPAFKQLKVAAVGKQTARQLQLQGKAVAIVPQKNFNSEALLALPELQSVRGQRIVIFRGENGRETLAQTLRERGASVTYITAYRRQIPQINLDDCPQIAQGHFDLSIVTSVEGLLNLFELLQHADWLRHKPILTLSQRIADKARQSGVKAPVFVSTGASDTHLLTALASFYQKIPSKE
ncbi:uroporphyrinogen-III synthase [Candidatus Venteria ishoeyi]|uniref:uroporphyrinogen-III synthase n=1 Tax=Candidatus Venteria ishoeyi TaxID=1899563 RepID=UPI0025A66184|nr:uroporphyrinogen-III synthase [Candidatus Venteria ishoeyi]MDM8548370.1 uroporphyrinogen-III synthase [Candidatus Venteria ishoeyi]